jgi:SRSO17 transposase
MTVFQIFTLGNNFPNKKKIITRNCKSCEYKVCTVITSFYSQFKLSANELKKRRLNQINRALNVNAITVVIDETGYREKGKKTDYVARQYLGNVGKIDNGIVTVNAYGVYCNITFPLIVKVFKPKGTLKESDKYKTKIELASEIITELIESGFNIELVLADSLYVESSQFLQKLTEKQLAYIVAIRSWSLAASHAEG